MKLKKKVKNNLALMNYFSINKFIKNSELFFFFPFYHIGGAEKVHLDILTLFTKKNTLCFITDTCLDKSFKSHFKKATPLLYLGNLKKNPFKKIVLKKIATLINKKESPVLFGCNSMFYYNLIPYLDSHVKVIDLIHAFSEGGAENKSLHLVPRIDRRIILGKKTLNDFKNLYQNNAIPESYLNRISIIKNKINTPDIIHSTKTKKQFNILFVSRNSPEKRPMIFFKIAEHFNETHPGINFNIIGDFKNYNKTIPSNTNLLGEISDINSINRHYKESSLILITSSREGLPMVILEAMAYGCVPISTNVGEISEIISPEKQTGWLINSTNEKEIINEFIATIDYAFKNKEMLNKYSIQGYKTVEKKYSATTFSKNYKELLNR